MKILNIIEAAYRGTIEEQDDTILWLTAIMKGAGGDFTVLVRGNAINHCVTAQDCSGLSFGGWKQTQPPRLANDTATEDESRIYPTCQRAGDFATYEIEIHDGVIQVDASIVGESLGLEPFEVQSLMREGKLTSSCERGVDEDEGRYRLTFFPGGRRLRLIIDGAGQIIRRSVVDFGTAACPR